MAHSIVVHHIDTHPCCKEFFVWESIGTHCQPKCGSCKCRRCPLGGKDYSLREEKELKLIEDGLKWADGQWTSSYPWIRDLPDLPDNRSIAFATLRSQEKRLLRNEHKANLYRKEMREMVENGVARKMLPHELKLYKGP